MNLSPKINSYIQYVKYKCSRKYQPGKPVCLMVLNINCHIKLPGLWKACISVWTTHGYNLPTALCMWHRPRTPPYSTVCYHVPSLGHGALSLRRCQRTPPPLSGGFCHAATATSPPFFFPFFFFCLIEIQLGTQTMPVSWHILERGEYETAYVFSLTFVLPPIIMDQCQLVNGYFLLCFFVFFYIYWMFCLLLTRWNEGFNSKPSWLQQPTVGDRVGSILIVVVSS